MLASFRSDVYLLRGQLKTLLGVFAFMMVFAFVQKSIYFAFFYPAFMSILLPISVFSLSEQSGWESMLLSAPVTRRGIVRGRYLTCAAVAVSSILIGFACSLLISMQEYEGAIIAVLAALTIVLLLNAILLPVLYQFGPTKARFIIMAVCIGPAVLLPLLMEKFETSNEQLLQDVLSLLSSVWFLLILLACSVVLFVLSYLISCLIYGKKEF